MGKATLAVHGLWLALSISTARGATFTNAVRMETYAGWEPALTLTGGDCRAVVVPAVGGRILQYALNGENVLFEEPTSSGRTLSNTPAGFVVGGYQCELGPQGRFPENLAVRLGAWSWAVPREATISLTSEPDRSLGIQLEKEILMDADSGELGLTQWARNRATTNTTLNLCDRTLCRPGGFVFFPLKGNSRFKAGWALGTEAGGQVTYDGTKPADSRVKVLGGVLVVQARGPALKLTSDSDAEWVAYALGRVLFVKYFPHYSDAAYADGQVMALSCDAKSTELSVFSPEVVIKPGQSYSFPEKWALHELKTAVNSFEQARNLVRLVPASPFRK